MSKKLIAVAAATALALTGLVGIAPAMANTPNIAITENAPGAGTSADPYILDVPAQNVIQTAAHSVTPTGGSAADTFTAITIAVGSSTQLAIGDTVTITATGAARLLEAEVGAASSNFNASTLGKTSFTYTQTTAGSRTVYAYTTSTAAATVVVAISRTGLNSSTTYHLKGKEGPKHTVRNVSGLPATLANTATATVSFEVYDVFGNVVEAAAAAVSLANTRVQMGAPTWNATTKKYESVLTSNSSSAFVGSLDIGAITIAGMPAPADSLAGVVNSPGASTQITSLTEQIASLTAQLAASVTKVKYNRLARKWNRANPSNKVKLAR